MKHGKLKYHVHTKKPPHRKLTAFIYYSIVEVQFDFSQLCSSEVAFANASNINTIKYKV